MKNFLPISKICQNYLRQTYFFFQKKNSRTFALEIFLVEQKILELRVIAKKISRYQMVQKCLFRREMTIKDLAEHVDFLRQRRHHHRFFTVSFCTSQMQLPCQKSVLQLFYGRFPALVLKSGTTAYPLSRSNTEKLSLNSSYTVSMVGLA